jgi:ABC-type phosphate transport system permease subunit
MNMTTKVHGGVKGGFWTEGALQFYTVAVLPAGSMDYVIATDGVTVVTNSVLDAVIKTVDASANVVGVEYTEGVASVKIAVARSGWTAATLQTALRALGATVAYNTYTSGGSDVVVATTGTFAAITVAAGASFVGTAA